VLVSLSPLGGKIGAPGFILLIPALPYLMPYFIWVLLVTSAGPVGPASVFRQPLPPVTSEEIAADSSGDHDRADALCLAQSSCRLKHDEVRARSMTDRSYQFAR
jgi:hypothetical protein